MKQIISLSGFAASGKSSVGKKVASILNWKFISIGSFTRKFAKNNYDMNILIFQEYCKNYPRIDRMIDSKFCNIINKSSNLVVDYRLAYYFSPNIFNVFLSVREDTAIKRLLNNKRNDEFKINKFSFIKKNMNERNNNMIKRFLKEYNTDFSDLSNYNLIVNTEEFDDINKISEYIIKKYKNQ